MGKQTSWPQQFDEPTFVHVTGEGLSRVGLVRDLRIGGFLCELMEEDQAPDPGAVVAKIYSHCQNVCLEGLPCTLLLSLPADPVPCSTIPTRRWALKFEELTPDQQRSLWILLSNPAPGARHGRERRRRRLSKIQNPTDAHMQPPAADPSGPAAASAQ